MSTVKIEMPEWRVTIRNKPVYDRIAGPHHRLDISIEQKVSDANMMVEPHGIVGQSFDGDDKPRNGKVDVYPDRHIAGEFTTTAMAEGAIEGKASQYEMSSKYATVFAFSRFDAQIRNRLFTSLNKILRKSRISDYEESEEEKEEWKNRPASSLEGRKLSETCDCGQYWDWLNTYEGPRIPPMPPLSPE
jgi:hypothetical protein